MKPDISIAQEMEVDPNSVHSSFDSNETSNPNLKRICYNLEKKAMILYFHKQGNSINKCAKHFSIDMRLKQVNGIVTNFIPPRMTNLLQPADVSWFASIKKQYHNKWNKWFLEDERSFTRFGNTKSPVYVNENEPRNANCFLFQNDKNQNLKKRVPGSKPKS
ncbi:hypothetical protein BpHYR1_039126 [Brachionus plicatilis]|uniref:DDE-1 domain-containing protein n=1 Tax=Brachionus plicatilis TaxID=10195 RepID=A0A3M7PYF3_BRAPC|nr:hypothetical protein BpHYR1_039126 [Brachionus plicatilis]